MFSIGSRACALGPHKLDNSVFLLRSFLNGTSGEEVTFKDFNRVHVWACGWLSPSEEREEPTQGLWKILR
jgi:hypothetical protein